MSGPTWRRTRPRTSTWRPKAGSGAPRRPSSTSTGPGTPLVEIVTQPDLALGRPGAALPAAASPDGRRAGDLRRRDGEGLAALRRQRLRAARGLGRAAHPHRAEEPELVRLRREGDPARGRAPDRRVRGRRRDRAGDAALRSRRRVSASSALEGRGAGLSLLPRAGPRPDRASAGARQFAFVQSCPSYRASGFGGSRPSSTTISPSTSSRADAIASTQPCRARTAGRSRTCS